METPFALYDALSAIDVPPEKIRVVVQSMERDMALYATQSQFASLDQYSGSRFDLLRAEMAIFRERLDRIDGRFDQIDKRFEQVEKRFEQVDDRFDQVDSRFVRTEQQAEQRFQLVDRRFDELNRKLDSALHEMEQRLMVRMGSFLAVAVGVTAGLVTLLAG
jgi:tetrahydromethanopterin S-methyltransferase subunit G